MNERAIITAVVVLACVVATTSSTFGLDSLGFSKKSASNNLLSEKRDASGSGIGSHRGKEPSLKKANPGLKKAGRPGLKEAGRLVIKKTGPFLKKAGRGLKKTGRLVIKKTGPFLKKAGRGLKKTGRLVIKKTGPFLKKAGRGLKKVYKVGTKLNSLNRLRKLVTGHDHALKGSDLRPGEPTEGGSVDLKAFNNRGDPQYRVLNEVNKKLKKMKRTQ